MNINWLGFGWSAMCPKTQQDCGADKEIIVDIPVNGYSTLTSKIAFG